MSLYDNLPIYILISLVLVFFTIFIYIKLAFPFWNIQPVYHSYDFWRCLYSRPFRIYGKFHPSVKTKYCRPENVVIVPFSNATMEQKKAFVNMVQCYFVKDEKTMCMFHLENLESYFSGHVYGSYLSLYTDVLYKSVKEEVIREEKPRGCISSRSGELVVRGHKENIYYIDFMTVMRGAEDKKIQREMFETHIYKTGLVEWKDLVVEPIRVWMFKHMGDLPGIVPMVRFMTSVYEIPNNPGFFEMGAKYPEHVVLVEIDKGNIRKMTDGLELARSKFSFFGITDVANLVGLVKSGVMYVYILERMGEIVSMYFFRDTRLCLEDEGSILELVGSVVLQGSPLLFRGGFLGSMGRIVKKNGIYKRLRVDNITDNGLLDWREWYCLGGERGGYYLFNMVVPFTGSTGDVFMMF